jgi:hypothetical protein
VILRPVEGQQGSQTGILLVCLPVFVWRNGMTTVLREGARRELDRALLAFRVARNGGVCEGGWLRGIRRAVGIPTAEVARRMKSAVGEVYRMEVAEAKARIELATLRRGAQALGCELVYAVVPREGTLEDLAAEQWAIVEKRRQAAKEARNRIRRKQFVQSGGYAAFLRAIRKQLRKHGVRVRRKPGGQR